MNGLSSLCLLLIVGWVFSEADGWGGHNAITRRATELLPKDDQEYLEPERELLWAVYCGFPDMNWGNYGELGGWSSDPDAPRMPDLRREWNISYYCLYDPFLQKGQFYPHMPPTVYEVTPIHFKNAVESIRSGHFEDGMRSLGALLHYAQDAGALPHFQPCHLKMSVSYSDLQEVSYAPVVLGETVEAASAGMVKRLQALVRFTEERRDRIVKQPPHCAETVECGRECLRVSADVIHALIHVAGPHPKIVDEPGIGRNLIANPGFEENEGDIAPSGWVVGWLNLKDKLCRAVYEDKRRVGRNADVTRSGSCSVKLMWTPVEGAEWRQRWPDAIRVRPGQVYRLTGWVRARSATGETRLAISFVKRNHEPVGEAATEALSGTVDWRECSVEFEVPNGAEKMRAVCRSRDNSGAVWFDDLSLVRLR